MSKDTASIRDQLGINPDIIQIPNFNYNQTFQIIETPLVASTKTLGHAWIVGSSSNGLVGANLGTEAGEQQVGGGAGRVETIVRVVCPNNTYREYFRDTDFKDTSQPNTADWDTTNYRLAMSSSTNKNRAYNTVATSKSIFLNSQTIFKATVSATETKFDKDIIKYFLSADSGSNWEECTLNEEHSFSVTGNDLRFRVVFFGNGGSLTYLENIKISYVV